MFGAISILIYGEKLGRRLAMIIGSIVLVCRFPSGVSPLLTLFQIFGAIIQSTSFGVPQMIVGRIVAGFGNGIISFT